LRASVYLIFFRLRGAAKIDQTAAWAVSKQLTGTDTLLDVLPTRARVHEP